MQLKNIFCLISLTVLLSACHETVDVKDGEVPAQYLSVAKDLVGSYPGQQSGVANTLNIRMDDYNEILISSENDLLDPFCQSKVGPLQKFSYDKFGDNVQLTSATFAFDANLCADKIQGDTITLDFEGPHHFGISILSRTVEEHSCEAEVGAVYYNSYYYGRGVGSEEGVSCAVYPVSYYITGNFAR